MSKEKPEFESPLRRYMRLNCTQCKDFPGGCNLITELGIKRIELCLRAAWLFGYEFRK